MEYQLAYLSRIKNVLIKQFYVKGTSGKMVDGLSDEDYSFFKEATRMPGMLKLLGGLKLYCADGTGNPKFDLPTIHHLVSEMNKKFTSIQLGTQNLAAVYKTYPATDYKIRRPKTTKGLITILSELQGNVTHKHKKKKTVAREEKLLSKKKAFEHKLQRIAAKLKFFKDELQKPNKFVALDFEAFERNQKRITEVGFSVYENGEYTNYHYIVEENIDRLNGKFVPNNKFNFEFGESEILPLEEAMNRLSEILSTADYMVAHSVGNELKWLHKNGVEVDETLKTIDTSILAGGFMKCGQRVSLTRILTFMGIEHGFLHNAGNDSFYTMKALHHMAHNDLDIPQAQML